MGRFTVWWALPAFGQEIEPQSYMERCSTQGDEKTTADPSFVGMTVLSVGQE
jgi:hypothetical protein